MTRHSITRLCACTGLLFSLSPFTCLHAQGTPDDYRRAFASRQTFTTSLVEGYVDEVHWTDSNSFTYRLTTDSRQQLWQGSISSDGMVTLCPSSLTPRDSNAFTGNQRPAIFTNRREHRRHWMETDDERHAAPVPSPDSSLVAFIRQDNIWIARPDGSEARQLSRTGTLSHYFSSYIRWSPDGRYVAANRIRPIDKRYVYYVESSPSDQLQPILHKQEYAKPGDELAQKTPHIFNVATGESHTPAHDLISNQYDLSQLEWRTDSRGIRFDYNQRGHKLYRIYEMDTTGVVSTLIEESAQTYVRYSNYSRHNLHGDSLILWLSERDGYPHLYLWSEAPAGKAVKNKGNKPLPATAAPMSGSLRQLTSGAWCVRRVVHIDEEKGRIIFTANGRNVGEDPYHIHYYSIRLDGTQLTDLTPEVANHSARFNTGYTALVDVYSTATMAPIAVLRSIDGHKLQLRPADNSTPDGLPASRAKTAGNNPSAIILSRGDLTALKAAGWQSPEVFVAPGRDGKTPLWGLIQRPSNFDPNKRYPVIEYIYAGPGDSYTPKSFAPWNYYLTPLAELGFIVVQLDAMGTSNRGKAFEEVCYKNLRDAGFPDRMAWLRAAAARYPYIDIDRVGIYGCSAGGQESTAAVLFHGDFYKAAYSACGCHDNRMDKIWWNEQWMGYPVDESYSECSNVDNAWRLTRPLMLVVGELDDNVDPASTMQVANALIKAGKDFDLVVIPGARHTVGEAFGEHKRYDFFVKHLLGIEPPAWNSLNQ